MYRICFTIGGKTYCISIPVLMWQWPWPPNGDPWKRVGDWVTHAEPGLIPWAVNLPILATVATLAEHAQGELKGQLHQVVKAATAEIQRQLPEGAKLQSSAARAA